MALRIPALLLICAAGCGHGAPAAPPPPPARDALPADALAVELPAQPLGRADLGDFLWRKRAGQPAFRSARKAEHREDWAAVEAACKEALAADPMHLEAAWLEAVALAKTGHLDGVLAPLETAGTGDFGKWALASLEQPALQAWLQTPTGAAWRRRVEQDRAAFLAAIGHGLIVKAHGDLYAYDGERFLRLTRTYGGVIGALPMRADHRIAYVSHNKDGRIGVGLVNLTTGRTSHATKLAGPVLRLAPDPKGVAIRIGMTWQVLDDDGHLHPLAVAPRPTEWLDVKDRTVHMHRAAPSGVQGDFDSQGLASAVRISLTSRTLTVPGQIDGSTIEWSPDHSHLAFVAQLDDSCTKPNAVSAAAFVADPSTGHIDELARATTGLSVEWITDRKLAIAGDHGVELFELGGKLVPLAGADGLIAPRRQPRCAAPEALDETTDDDVGDEGSDAPATP